MSELEWNVEGGGGPPPGPAPAQPSQRAVAITRTPVDPLDATIDVYCIDDFLPTMPAIRGREALMHRLARRLTTPRGRFIYWPDFGYDIRTALLSKKTPDQIANDVEAECLKDEQVEQVVATVSIDGTAAVIRLAVADADGPFEFTLTITEARATLSDLLEA